MTSRTQKRNADMGSAIYSAARNNPEALLLVAAGAALLLRTARPARRPPGARRDQRSPQEESRRSGQWVDTGPITEAMEGARNTAADLGSQFTDAASSYAASAQRYATGVGQTVADRSERFYEETTSMLGDTAQRILRDQPLVVALAGVAAGAALATAFPRTDFEEQTLGPAGERIAEFAGEKAEQFRDAGREAAERLKSSAEERGLTPDGMKDMAREAADAFTGALGGDASAARPAGEASGNERSG